jgi:hypothetical protein
MKTLSTSQAMMRRRSSSKPEGGTCRLPASSSKCSPQTTTGPGSRPVHSGCHSRRPHPASPAYPCPSRKVQLLPTVRYKRSQLHPKSEEGKIYLSQCSFCLLTRIINCDPKSAVFCQFCYGLRVGVGLLGGRVRSNYGVIPSNGSTLSASPLDTLTAV